ncbi:MAG: serine hydroxymethyltransferase, partial [Nitrospirota bacterium]
KGITGKEAEKALESAGITANKNTIPFDSQPPAITSGLRIGTPIVTTRGMKESQMKEIAMLISEVLDNHNRESVISDVRRKVSGLCEQYPIII